MKLLLYCTKGKPLFLTYGDCDHGDYATYFEEYVCDNRYYDYEYDDKVIEPKDFLNGKIVGECDFEVSEIEFKQAFYLNGPLYITKRKEPFKYFSYIDLLKESCLQDNEMLKYLGNKNGKAIHIKNLIVWNTPKSLERMGVKNSIKNMTRALALRVAGFTVERFIIIPVKPELMCKILNGECTIIVKKKVLKEMV